jgi:hypothetical protein
MTLFSNTCATPENNCHVFKHLLIRREKYEAPKHIARPSDIREKPLPEASAFPIKGNPWSIPWQIARGENRQNFAKWREIEG